MSVDLTRFLNAQANSYAQALAELRAGRKRTHWMWYVFPQFAGLGISPTSQHYAIQSLDEARTYLAHPVLGARLSECVQAVNAVQGRTAREIFGAPDDLKFCSSMTLFERACDPPCSEFSVALEKYYDGKRDARTLELIREAGG